MSRTLVYDADCAFCTRSAKWIEAHGKGRVQIAGYQHAGLDALGVTEEQAAHEVQWVDEQGRRAGGAEAIARALQAVGGGWRPLGVALWFPPIRPLARRAYRLVAENRHRMPGGSADRRAD